MGNQGGFCHECTILYVSTPSQYITWTYTQADAGTLANFGKNGKKKMTLILPDNVLISVLGLLLAQNFVVYKNLFNTHIQTVYLLLYVLSFI